MNCKMTKMDLDVDVKKWEIPRWTVAVVIPISTKRCVNLIAEARECRANLYVGAYLL